MRQTTGAKVPFTRENIDNCICPGCPVESGSKCASDGLKKLKETLRRDPVPENAVPALYCSSGATPCPDFDFKEACICEGCPVYQEYDLSNGEPLLYFCQKGKAK